MLWYKEILLGSDLPVILEKTRAQPLKRWHRKSMDAVFPWGDLCQRFGFPIMRGGPLVQNLSNACSEVTGTDKNLNNRKDPE